MVSAYLSLGSNLGNRLDNLKKALDLLNSHEGIEIKQVSSFYETEPVGYEEQDWFLNSVVEITTTLTPQELLKTVGWVEGELGRVRTIRWGPRTVDVDILFYGDQLVAEENLEIPHPRIQERAFVLKPLAEIVPDLVHPYYGQTVEELLENLVEPQGIKLYQIKE